MSLILGRAKLKAIQAATTLLLSPFEHGSLHTWRIRVNRAIGPLLGADMSSFLIPSAPEQPFLSEELPPITQASYPEIKAELDRKYRFPEREVALGVWNRHMLWRPYLKELYASEYYNDMVRPNRAFDAIAMSVGDGRPGMTSCVMFHHDRETGPRFGTKGLAILRLLYPAFVAALTTLADVDVRASALARSIDETDQAVAIFGERGEELHRGSAVGRLLDPDPERERVYTAMRAQAAVLAARRIHLPQPDAARASARELSTGMGRYALRATYLPERQFGFGLKVLVSVRRRGAAAAPPSAPDVASDAAFRERLGLSPRELAVARLMGEGLRTQAIAERLSLSPHTVRHHGESVFRKLDVHSRAAVGAALRAAADPYPLDPLRRA